MTNFDSTDTTDANRTDTSNTETDEHHSVTGGGRRTGDGATYRVHDGESIMETVVRAVGSETKTDPMRLQPLHSVIDTEALNELFDSRNRGTARADGYVTFNYCGFQVRVGADETVKIDRPG